MPSSASTTLAATDAAQTKQLRTAAILGLGHSLPPTVVGNSEFKRTLGLDDEWITRRMGVKTRRRVDGQSLVDLATDAAQAALRDARVKASQVDLVLVATMTPDQITPNAAPMIATALGAERAGAMDIGAACTGWLSALSLACAQIEAGRATTAVVIGAEILSRVTNFEDKRTAPLFGDGAGAVVVGVSGSGTVGPILLESDATSAQSITCEVDERKVRMDGVDTFKKAVKALVESTETACAQANKTLAEIDLFVYHQANGRILETVAERLSLPQEKVVNYISETANTSAASIPLSLSLARADGRLHVGDSVLLAAVGGGFTWGAGVIEWGAP